MKYDQYGNPIHPHTGQVTSYGQVAPPYQQRGRSEFAAPPPPMAKMNMPSMNDLGGRQGVPWVRFPYYPTAPFYSTNPNVGTQTRFYGATLLSTDSDVTVGSETIRTVQFDIPVRIIAINGCATETSAGASAFTSGNNLNTFLFRAEYTTGDKLMTGARLASTVIGSQENPGEIGGTGYTIDAGASLVLGITPLALLTGLTYRIDITLVCLEIRGRSNIGL